LRVWGFSGEKGGVKHKYNHIQQVNFYKLSELISKIPWEQWIKEKNILDFLKNIKGTKSIYSNARKQFVKVNQMD